MDTDQIIARLVQDAPARRLPGPAARAALWIIFALISVGAVVYAMSLRPDLAMRMSDARFVIEQVSRRWRQVCVYRNHIPKGFLSRRLSNRQVVTRKV